VGTAVAFVPPFATGRTPVTPVVSGSPVRLVATPDVGVPRSGVTSVGEVLRTTLPVPVLVVTPVPPLRTGRAVPERPIAKVPVVVTGEPEMLRNAGTVAATLVTVPAPLTVVHVGAVVPVEVSIWPAVPAAVNAYAVPVP
jgi:hypothetical protein